MLTAIAITNDNAGSTDEDAVAAALEVLRTGFEVRVVSTASDAELDKELTGEEVVIVIGGDGSLHAVVSSLARLDRLGAVTLGLIPLGTGNDFARSLAIPDGPADSARLIVDGHRVTVDLVRDDAGGTVVNAVHLGAGAEAAERAETWKEALGPVGYAVGTLISGADHDPLDVQVSVDGRALPAGNGILQVAINNGKYVGGGTPLAPQADPGDGELDVLVSYAVGATERLGYLRDLRDGTHIERDDVMTVRGTTVSVHGEPFSCSADGEIERGVTARTWSLEPAALTMFAAASVT
ncbi:MAG: hypothetical protein M3Q98_06195 [Actinomycetota bacterium]|nr:hypothetical protein [Actinomycetota bacterium]